MEEKTLLNPSEFTIEDTWCEDEDNPRESVEKGMAACKRLIDKWTPEIEAQMLEAFVKLYYDRMYKNWGPVDAKEYEEYWPQIKTPKDLLKYTGTDVFIYGLEDGIYAKSKTGETEYESQNIDMSVILVLDCPWDEDHGWAAVFIDEKFVKVDRDIVNCVWLD